MYFTKPTQDSLLNRDNNNNYIEFYDLIVNKYEEDIYDYNFITGIPELLQQKDDIILPL